jgi:3-hydroxyisobutyrate dehydrogenase-like beta-hydroxyacid dehydrogenase
MTMDNDGGRARCLDAAQHPVTRYVATYVNKDGMRTLMTAAQGQYTYATPEEAQAWLDAVFTTTTNSPATLESVWGKNPRCEVRPCDCWAGHFDPMGVYFD